MSSNGDSDNEGPTVDSENPEERVAARRLRITRRIEAAKRAERGEDLDDAKEAKEELSKSRKQIEASRLRLTKLIEDGVELVTNIRVGCDAREAARRTDEEVKKQDRNGKLKHEGKTMAEKFENITKKWESALQKEIPQSLRAELKQQKDSCDQLVSDKNKIINDYQKVLKEKDDSHVKDLKKQAEDIELMTARMDEQIASLTKAYKEELREIENAFTAERNELLELQKKKWEDKMEGRRQKEIEYMKGREKRVEDFENSIHETRIKDSEEYNDIKISLETNIQILEQQLQQMKATYQLNQEKLEYNYQVLRKREDENNITRSQQKRKITRLSDVLSGLKIKLAKQEKQYKDENTQLSDDYKRITEQFRDLQRKSRHFMQADAKKFHDVWCMNEEECKELAHGVLEADRIVFEHQLGLKYQTPDVAFLENVGPLNIDESKKSGVSAHQIVQEVMSQTAGSQVEEPKEDDDADSIPADRKPVKSTLLSKINANVIKSILELLCDESGYLVEQKLNKLLTPLEKDERSLMKLDAIFTALGIETEEDIHLLSSYFMHVKGGKPQQTEEKETDEFDTQTDMTGEMEDIDEEIRKLTGKEGDNVSTNSESIELIHPNEVLKGLRAFVEENKQPPKEKGKQSHFKIQALEERDSSQDSEYWSRYAKLIDTPKERLWDALIEGLEKYSETLTSRSNLINETEALKQQNAELRMLLHQYVNSKVNAELEIPPTRVLQLEMNPMR
ncbi:dynein regulatory complex protein 1-like [Mytilus californianus]|uniref:dynein regulatory complex protein 1-like n=1 Tax=Mytilus californianus TaxID=6549 RepID=UPI002246F9A7|nr:dynein regulatory complex protein 1-like [Mytilus californianus]